MRILLFAAAATLVLSACGESDTTEAEVEYTSVVSTVLNANVGPNGEEQAFVVEVTHDEDEVTREQARRIAVNVRIQRATARSGGFGRHVVPADSHWAEDNDHGFRVRVRPVIDEGQADRLRDMAWEWMEEAVAALHCPPGH